MTPADREGRVDEAIAEYLAACDAGAPPDRAAFLARHADVAGSLGAFLDDHAGMRRLAPGETVGYDGPAAAPGVTVRYFGDYELQEEIARGGMGVVYRAKQVSLNRTVAVKMILAGHLATPADVLRFRTEAEAAANLDHPNVLPVYEVGEHQGQQYFSMKLAAGSLADRVAGFAGKPRAAAAVVATVARAVHVAHQSGILHRDLKPANVLLDEAGTPLVTDFGLAKKLDADHGQTRTGAMLGTPAYMAPEQARGERGLTTAADVYSLGAILYELLAGRPPFQGDTVYAVVKQVIEAEPAAPPGDRDLAAVAMKCLAKNPADRYASAGELADDLDRWAAGEATKARPASLAGQAWRWLRRNAATAAAVVALGVLWGVATGVFLAAIDNDYHAGWRPMRLFVAGETWFNPVGWAYRVRAVPAARTTVVVVGLALWLGIGWWVRAVVRPRSPAAAVGSAAAVGLIGAWVASLFIAPILTGNVRVQLYPLAAEEPPAWRSDADGRNFRLTQPGSDAPHPDLPTLAAHVPPERRDPTRRENAAEYSKAHDDLMEANRHYRVMVAAWVAQFSALMFFLTAAVAGGWAADFLARSGRGWPARAGCYAELYPPTMVTLYAIIGVAATPMIASAGQLNEGPSYVWVGVALLTASSGVVGVAYAGVVRGWRWWVRLAAYALWLGLHAAVIWASGMAG